MTAPNAKPRAGEHTPLNGLQEAADNICAKLDRVRAERDVLAAQNGALVEALESVRNYTIGTGAFINKEGYPSSPVDRLNAIEEIARDLLATVRP